MIVKLVIKVGQGERATSRWNWTLVAKGAISCVMKDLCFFCGM